MYKYTVYHTIAIFILGLLCLWLFISKMHMFEIAQNSVNYEVYAYNQNNSSISIDEVSDSSFTKKLSYLNKENWIMHQANSVYWVKLVLKNRMNNNNYILVPGTSYNFIEVYVKKGNSFKQLPPNIIGKFLGVNINTEMPYFVLPQNSDKEIFIRMSNTYATGIGFEIITNNNYFDSLISIYSLYAFYLGGMLFLMVYILIFYLKSKENTYLTYFFYLVSIVVFSLFHWKFFDSYMSSLFYLNLWHTTSYSLITISILAHCLEFYKEELKNSTFQNLLRISIGVKLTFWFLAIATNHFWINDRWIDIVVLLPVIIYSLRYFSHQRTSFWYFGFGMIMLYIGMIVMLIPRFSYDFSDNNLFFITSISQTYLLFFSIADKYALLKIEKETALKEALSLQLSLNTQLEEGIQKVRTELQTAYLEIKRINSLLKNDNQKLQKNLKDNTMNRLENQLMSYQEFNNLFPDELTCQKYIANMKWSKNQQCIKCGSTTFYNLSSSFGRRCRSCQYLESATAHTIFENIRFPISKAFYILYRCSIEPTSKQMNLPLILELRAGTCTLFRKKVLEQMQIKNFNPQKDAWEKLIMV